MHIAGAINLSFPDIAADSLRQTIPYDYRNIYELGPQLDPKDSLLPF